MLSKPLTKARKAAKLLTRPIWRMGLRHGVAATVEHWPLASLIQPRTVIDIGANKGQFTLFALEAFPGCRVFAFEPLPGPATKFREVTAGRQEVRLFEAAIGPESGTADIHVSAREDSSSLLPMSERMGEVFPEAVASGERQSVRVAPLDELLGANDVDPPCLLKLDVQGYELEALKGCRSLLPLVDHVYVECSYIELYRGQVLIAGLTESLTKAGYRRLIELNRVDASDGPIQSDCLFARNSREAQRS